MEQLAQQQEELFDTHNEAVPTDIELVTTSVWVSSTHQHVFPVREAFTNTSIGDTSSELLGFH